MKKYDVTYIIVGQYERLWYKGAGQDKFKALSGKLWDKVYQYKDTAIYKVIPRPVIHKTVLPVLGVSGLWSGWVLHTGRDF